MGIHKDRTITIIILKDCHRMIFLLLIILVTTDSPHQTLTFLACHCLARTTLLVALVTREITTIESDKILHSFVLWWMSVPYSQAFDLGVGERIQEKVWILAGHHPIAFSWRSFLNPYCALPVFIAFHEITFFWGISNIHTLFLCFKFMHTPLSLHF